MRPSRRWTLAGPRVGHGAQSRRPRTLAPGAAPRPRGRDGVQQSHATGGGSARRPRRLRSGSGRLHARRAARHARVGDAAGRPLHLAVAVSGAPEIGTLFTNAKVFTGTGEDDFVSAFRVEEGRFTWIGDADTVAHEQAVDLGGRTVLPGLIDSHTHPALVIANGHSVECFPPAVTSVEELLAALRTHPALGAGPDAWILGRGFDETKYPGARMPTASDLDRVSRDQPVMVWRCDAHSAVCNTRALELAGSRRTRPIRAEPASSATPMASPTASSPRSPPPPPSRA
ncbi:amidohydrolase family protein [Microbacterium sp. NIBRBAC000506063]|uniref:amidohydrolase family protein n=1 Tax=Microbacterium sp. NIBRBAC000506063 TaxID=2734618 RepID=UPI00397EF50A